MIDRVRAVLSTERWQTMTAIAEQVGVTTHAVNSALYDLRAFGEVDAHATDRQRPRGGWLLVYRAIPGARGRSRTGATCGNAALTDKGE